MSLNRKSVPLLILALGLLVGGTTLVYRYNYPYGARPGCLPILLEALRGYATDHGGAFPDGSGEPLRTLRNLYPRYLANPWPLAGLSGDRRLLEKQVRENADITAAASSWVYWPGLRSDDNPDIAVVWERRSGLRYNGSRAGGHEVGFIGGYMKQVSDANWEVFMSDQKMLREKALAGRRVTAK